MVNILVVEDEISIQKIIKYDLENAGYNVDTCGNGLEGVELAKKNKYEIILLDLMLPGLNGIDACKEIRVFNTNVHITLLTAVGDEMSKLDAFNAGADDYIVKPFSMREVIARIKVALKRSSTNNSIISYKHLVVNNQMRTVTKDGEDVKLTYTEFELLMYLLINKNNVVSREELLDKIWGYDYKGETRTVDVYAHKLRDKLKLSDDLKTVHGIGYILKD